MLKTDVEILMTQLRNVALNKTEAFDKSVETEELKEIQKAISYFSQCLMESNDFLKNMSIGNLDTKTPSRHNFLAGNLKELHADLKHLAWQAEQVAKGDYNQRVGFLGKFSESFNSMIAQLDEREKKLKDQALEMSRINDLMVSVMDLLNDWIVVTQASTGKILYVNQSANELFYNMEEKKSVCGLHCELLERICALQNLDDEIYFDYYCHKNGKTLYIRSNSISWKGEIAYTHIISDVTLERGEKEKLKKMAFRDELTGLHNRRYCMNQLRELLKCKKNFSICMIDLDGLKTVNDKYGHISGDEYIISVADNMKKACRKTDIACRIGGDELVLIFPECSKENAVSKMMNLSDKIASMELGYPMSISYGIVFVDENQDLSSDKILQMADDEMYKIKKTKHKARY